LLTAVAALAARAETPTPPTPPTPPRPPHVHHDDAGDEHRTRREQLDLGALKVGIDLEDDDGWVAGHRDDPLSVLGRLPPDVRDKLSAEQIEDIVRRAQQPPPSSALEMVEVLVPLGFFGSIVGVVALIMFARHRRELLLHTTLRTMIERGSDIPPALLSPQKPPPNDRRRGIILLATGVGVTLFLYVVSGGEEGAWGIGLVPTLIGVGYLLAAALGSRAIDPSFPHDGAGASSPASPGSDPTAGL
jgi:hypothetical protein